ncbi:MAG: DUF3150 domain-containing protein [Candidatus Stygibacter australis]|nr:DUF3150 domain-containing protein [Candidatus Stygibacter australis]
MSLNEKAMLVHLNISFWTARKYDRKISREIEIQYNADEAGRYNKILIANEYLANIRKMVSAARTFHYENTLPWNDNGGRLLPAANYFNYVKAMQNLQADFDRETANFIRVYPDLKNEAKLRLNGMFDEEDYPDISTLRTKYAFSSQVTPVPEAEDFRVKLNDSEVDSIKQSIERQVQNSTREAMNDLWNRLFRVVNHMAERLADPDNKFKNSLVDNIVDLCDLLPRLNITSDPKLEDALLEVRQKLTANDSQILRDNDVVRTKTAAEAQKILDKMKHYLPAA